MASVTTGACSFGLGRVLPTFRLVFKEVCLPIALTSASMIGFGEGLTSGLLTEITLVTGAGLNAED